jgi:hypothetical protein
VKILNEEGKKKTFSMNVNDFDKRGNMKFGDGETFYYGPKQEPYY